MSCTVFFPEKDANSVLFWFLCGLYNNPGETEQSSLHDCLVWKWYCEWHCLSHCTCWIIHIMIHLRWYNFCCKEARPYWISAPDRTQILQYISSLVSLTFIQALLHSWQYSKLRKSLAKAWQSLLRPRVRQISWETQKTCMQNEQEQNKLISLIRCCNSIQKYTNIFL